MPRMFQSIQVQASRLAVSFPLGKYLDEDHDCQGSSLILNDSENSIRTFCCCTGGGGGVTGS